MKDVDWEDQQQINEFSKLHARETEYEGKLSDLEKEKELVTDLSNELELVDEDEHVPLKIGDAFMYIPQSQVMSRLEAQQEKIEEESAEWREKVSQNMTRKEELKKELYQKFGNTINLEAWKEAQQTNTDIAVIPVTMPSYYYKNKHHMYK